jgi:GT2 family glycosyltransferase
VISYVLPTRDRPDVLGATLDALASLGPHEAEVIVVDNASRVPPRVPMRLASGVPVRLLLLERNLGAAARNEGVRAMDAASDWVVMLDDDSSPMDPGVLGAIRRAEPDVGAIAAEIFLDDGAAGTARRAGDVRRESGGLPEVIIGCGAAIRREAWDSTAIAGQSVGYDPAFGYYAEEYDLCARLLLGGWRVALDRGFRVLHRKVSAGRDMDLILRRLVRNNAWTIARYGPRGTRRAEIARTVLRYGRIAALERAELGFGQGLGELALTLWRQPRLEMPRTLWDRFTGLAAARAALQAEFSRRAFRTAALVDEGKNVEVVGRALGELGVRVVGDPDAAEALVVGTLSPGPMLDALERRRADASMGTPRIVAPWLVDPVRSGLAAWAA